MRTPFLTSVLVLAACTPTGETGETGETDVVAEPTDFGFVYLSSEPGLGFSDAGAVFRRALPHAYDCDEVEVEGCTVLTCGDSPLAFDPVDVGAVTITGAASAVAMSFTAGGGYDGPFLPDEELFQGGEELAASAPGADGPAFALSLEAPSAVTITEPAWPSGQASLAVPRDAGFAFTWTGASAGDVVANLSNQDQSVAVSCAFPAADGTAVVPAAALAALPAGGGFLDLEVRSRASERADTWQVQFSAFTHALVSATDPAIATVDLE